MITDPKADGWMKRLSVELGEDVCDKGVSFEHLHNFSSITLDSFINLIKNTLMEFTLYSRSPSLINRLLVIFFTNFYFSSLND